MTAIGLPADAAVPDNDALANATLITAMPFTDATHTSQASIEAGEPVCASTAPADKTVWYRLVVPGSDAYRFTASGALVSVYRSFDRRGASELRDRPADSYACNVGAATVRLRRGEQVFISLSSPAGYAGGPAVLDVARMFTSEPNDDFADAFPVTTVPFSDSFTPIETSDQGETHGECFPMARDVWYRFTAPADGRYVARAASRNDTPGNSDAAIMVATGPSAHLLRAVDCGSDAVDSFTSARRASFRAGAGDVFWIAAGTMNDPDPIIDFTLQRIDVAPVNDDQGDATTIGGLPYRETIEQAGATVEPGEYQYSMSRLYVAGSANAGRWEGCNATTESVWYRLTPDRRMLANISTSSVEGSSTYSVFVETIDGPKPVGACSNGPFLLNEGSRYLIQVGRVPEGSPPGRIDLQITGIAASL